MTDWIVAITTIVYAVLTFLVCIFNYRSSKAAIEQCKEMRREYDNSLRIKMMPFFSVQHKDALKNICGHVHISFGDCRKSEYFCEKIYFTITNVGHDVAKHITYWMGAKDATALQEIVYLPPYEYRNICVCIHLFGDEVDRVPGNQIIRIMYQDLFDNNYSQDFYIEFCYNHGRLNLITYYITAPILANETDRANKIALPT